MWFQHHTKVTRGRYTKHWSCFSLEWVFCYHFDVATKWPHGNINHFLIHFLVSQLYLFNVFWNFLTGTHWPAYVYVLARYRKGDQNISEPIMFMFTDVVWNTSTLHTKLLSVRFHTELILLYNYISKLFPTKKIPELLLNQNWCTQRGGYWYATVSICNKNILLVHFCGKSNTIHAHFCTLWQKEYRHISPARRLTEEHYI